MSSSPSISLKEINRLALPAIASGIAEPVIALIDTAFIGSIGKVALGGIGLGSSLFLLFVWTLTQTRTALSAIVSQHLGAGRLDDIRGLVPQVMVFVIALGLLSTWCCRSYGVELLQLYSAQGELLDMAWSYFSIRSLGFPLVMATYCIFGIFRGMQNTSWAMYISIGAALLNVLFDVLLIFGVDGLIPPMGIEGAAWASLIAQVAMFIAALVMLKNRTPFRFIDIKKKSDQWGPFLSMSFGFMLRTMALNATFFFANRLATSYSAAHIAAHTIAVNIWLFSSYFIDGYANAGNALSGKLLGSGDVNEIYFLGRRLVILSIMIGAILAGVYLILYPWMGSFFSNNDEVIALFGTIYWMVIIAQPLNAIAFSLDGLFKGLGRAGLLVVTLLTATFLGFFPAIFFGSYFGVGLYGIWAAFIFFMGIRAGTLWWEFRRKYRPADL